jgi:phage protein U
MLYQVGTVQFEVLPFNTHDVSGDSSTDYADKDVVGARRPAEHVGEGEENLSLKGKIFPHAIGGLSSLNELQALRASGRPQFVMRGDGTVMGWFTIRQISQQHSHLDVRGVGGMIDFEVSMKRAPDGSFFDQIENIFSLLS